LRVVRSNRELSEVLSEWRGNKSKIGFVPTMGALHRGHLDLVEKSQEENDYTVVSIFVNPKQFNNVSDFEKYPDKIDKDIELLNSIECDLLYHPKYDEVYPSDIKKVILDLGAINEVFEAPERPGHFDGVVQVVHRFFDLIMPENAYFGLKDYQQCMVIQKLRDAYFKKIHLHFCPTIRLESGLAMSSRNERLSQPGLKKAASIFKSLSHVKNLYQQVVPKDALYFAKHLLEENGFKVEYLDLANSDNLHASNKWLKKGKNLVVVAAWLEGVRLIDNIQF
jgi:pantoate--beta-alanine ligase